MTDKKAEKESKGAKDAKSASESYTKYERARIIGTRALQISTGAPFLLKLAEDELEKLKHSPVNIAELEFEKGLIPIRIKRPAVKGQ